jgi:hypothetical protein
MVSTLSDRDGSPPSKAATVDPGRDQPSANGAPSSESARLLETVVTEFAEAAQHVRVLLNVRADRAGLQVRRAIEGAVSRALLWSAVAGLAVCGLVMFAAGLAETLSALLEPRPWLGKLAAGVLLLGGAAVWVAVLRARSERAELERLRRKYEELEGSVGGERACTRDSHAGGLAGRGGAGGPPESAPQPAQRAR